ncbi:MAG: S-adenosylmethionine synthetase, partial [Rhodothermales bacterium]
RSAAYMARYAAKNVVAAGLAKKCEVQVSYAIGVAHPLSVNIATFGTSTLSESALQALLENPEIFDFSPSAIVENLGLKNPQGWSYQDTTSGGHFGRSQFPWEKTDKVAALKAAAGIA